MLNIDFEGWFQVRLATDPDPCDEPRGISGTTFALAGEPDFDRVVRFHDPVAPRTLGQEVGVTVRRVLVDGAEAAGHALVGGRVELLGEPTFANHNNVVTISETEPLDPFHLRVASPDGRVVLQRLDEWDPEHPGRTAFDVRPELQARRIGRLEKGSHEMARATGIEDYAAFRAERRRALTALLERAQDPTERLALEKRLRELSRPDEPYPAERLGYCMRYEHGLDGPAVVQDPDGVLGEVDTRRGWSVSLTLGAYDSDTLCGYALGSLSLP
jgi:hypothetical protein